MINEVKTFEKFGYYSTDWAPKSHKKICVVCDNCGGERVLEKADYCDLCRSCKHLGHVVTKETRQKLRDANIGKHHTEESKLKMSKSLEGRKLSEEHKRKIGNGHRGKKISEEQKRNHSKMMTGRKASKETRKKLSKIHSGKNNHMYGKTGEKSPHWLGGERVSSRKYRTKRRKMLDPNPIDLNKDFNNSHGHHVDAKYVIHIPAKLHRSVRHRQTDGDGMNKINKLAFKYLLNNKESMIVSDETALYINLMVL